MKKFKNSSIEQPMVWRGHRARHKDIVPAKVLPFGAWRQVFEHAKGCEGLLKEEATLRYSQEVLKVFTDATRRCPTVSIRQDVMDGQPCIDGTRIPVRTVLRALEQYGSIDEVRKCYPHLTKDQVEDALYFSQIVLELPGGLDETSSTS